MHLSVIARVFGLLLLVFSLNFLAPLGVSLYYQDGQQHAFLSAFSITVLCGVALAFFASKEKALDLAPRDGFLITAMYWYLTALFGSLPFMLSTEPHLSVADAFFESVSGMTTTGASVLSGLDQLPKSILFHRAWLQFMGGIGVVVMAVAILPMLGIGGMQLFKAETPGPMKDAKLTPRIASTAKALFTIYFSLTVACALCYWLAGMTPFDAITHAFTTVATGGFANYDSSLGYFQSDLILWIAIVFMVIAALNFGLHYIAWHQRSLRIWWQDSESRYFIKLLLAFTLITVALLTWHGVHDNTFDTVTHALFHVISDVTTTGFAASDYTAWPGALPLFLIVIAFLGGCAGSTAGGIKAIRILLASKLALREMKRLIHPNAIFHIKASGKVVPERVLSAVWGFLMFYVFSYVVLVLLVQTTGVDLMTAAAAVAFTLNNTGMGLAGVGSNYSSLNDFATWLLSFAMLLGRLELFTLLVLFHPMFWRK